MCGVLVVVETTAATISQEETGEARAWRHEAQNSICSIQIQLQEKKGAGPCVVPFFRS